MKNNLAKKISISLAVIAVIAVISASILLVLERTEETIIVTVTPTKSPAPHILKSLPVLSFKAFESVNTLATWQDKQYNSTGRTAGLKTQSSVTISKNGVNQKPTAKSPIILNPGQQKPETTQSTPLAYAPRRLGFLVMTPDAGQALTSLNDFNGGFGQLTRETADQKQFVHPKLVSGQNMILNCSTQNKSSLSSLNNRAYGVGCMGLKSMHINYSGTRLFVATEHNYQGRDSTTGTLLPWNNMAGSVSVFDRPIDPSTDAVNPLASSNVWTYNCGLDMINPYGGQSSSIYGIKNNFTGQWKYGDNFGAYIDSSTNRSRATLQVAVYTNSFTKEEYGAAVIIHEEQNNNSYKVVAALQLPDKLGEDSYTEGNKTAFGMTFAIGDNHIMIQMHDQADTVTKHNSIICYERNDKNVWEYQQTLKGASSVEIFGTSIIMNQKGDFAIVGSPTGKGGHGGSIYCYQYTGKIWKKTQTVTASDVGAGDYKLSFGYFLNADHDFTVLSLTAQTDSKLTNAPKAKSTSDLPIVIIVSIDNKNYKLSKHYLDTQFSNGGFSNDDVADPLIGCRVGLAFTDDEYTVLNVVIGSPCNGKSVQLKMDVTIVS